MNSDRESVVGFLAFVEPATVVTGVCTRVTDIIESESDALPVEPPRHRRIQIEERQGVHMVNQRDLEKAAGT